MRSVNICGAKDIAAKPIIKEITALIIELLSLISNEEDIVVLAIPKAQQRSITINPTGYKTLYISEIVRFNLEFFSTKLNPPFSIVVRVSPVCSRKLKRLKKIQELKYSFS